MRPIASTVSLAMARKLVVIGLVALAGGCIGSTSAHDSDGRVPRAPSLARAPVELRQTPRWIAELCATNALLRPGCPAVVPRGVPSTSVYLETFPDRPATLSIESGGQYYGRPRRNRPPRYVHVTVAAKRLTAVGAARWARPVLPAARPGDAVRSDTGRAELVSRPSWCRGSGPDRRWDGRHAMDRDARLGDRRVREPAATGRALPARDPARALRLCRRRRGAKRQHVRVGLARPLERAVERRGSVPPAPQPAPEVPPLRGERRRRMPAMAVRSCARDAPSGHDARPRIRGVVAGAARDADVGRTPRSPRAGRLLREPSLLPVAGRRRRRPARPPRLGAVPRDGRRAPPDGLVARRVATTRAPRGRRAGAQGRARTRGRSRRGAATARPAPARLRPSRRGRRPRRRPPQPR